jgi:pSer/pThr/pTyr-binding forkhead associated (FHA) protein
VIPIRKRVETAFLTSISVGRARNHDIVLRHASISKFHANLDVEGTQLFVKDAGSRNHTFVNHERINARVEVRAGDNLRFGWVEALVASDEALFRALREP